MVPGLKLDATGNWALYGCSVTEQPYNAQYPVASSFSPGTILRLKAIAKDFSGNQAEATATSVVVRAATLTKSLVTGEVYDDTSGLPLPDVTVALTGVGT